MDILERKRRLRDFSQRGFAGSARPCEIPSLEFVPLKLLACPRPSLETVPEGAEYR